MREQQNKMLADLKAKKDAKENEEEEKRKKYEKQLAKAREQVMKNYEDIPEKPVEPEGTADDTGKKKVIKYTDKTCQ